MSLVNRILSALLALALLLGGLLAAVEIVVAGLGRPPWLVPHEAWSSWLGQETWDTPVVRVILAGLVLLGLLVLLPALRRGRPASLPLASATQEVHLRASCRGVQRSLAAVARRTSGVSAASVSVGRRTVRVKATSRNRSEGNVALEVTSAVAGRLDQLGLSDTLRPRVTLSRKDAR